MIKDVILGCMIDRSSFLVKLFIKFAMLSGAGVFDTPEGVLDTYVGVFDSTI
jgi:hypothetical protein